MLISRLNVREHAHGVISRIDVSKGVQDRKLDVTTVNQIMMKRKRRKRKTTVNKIMVKIRRRKRKRQRPLHIGESGKNGAIVQDLNRLE